MARARAEVQPYNTDNNLEFGRCENSSIKRLSPGILFLGTLCAETVGL